MATSIGEKLQDEILKDGGEIGERMRSSAMGIDIMSYLEKSKEDSLKSGIESLQYPLKENWRNLQKFQEKYPNSEYAKNQLSSVQKKAKEHLSSEMYTEIYEK